MGMPQSTRLHLALLLLVAQLRAAAADPSRHFAPQRWWCAEERGHSSSMMCKTAKLKEAIANEDTQDGKESRVNEFKAAVLKGEAEAEGLDATNPERQVRQTFDGDPRLALA